MKLKFKTFILIAVLLYGLAMFASTDETKQGEVTKSENQIKTENINTSSDELSKDRKEELLKKISSMSIVDIHEYARDLGGFEKDYRSAIFILEYTAKHQQALVEKERLGIYHTLGRYYAGLENTKEMEKYYIKFFNLRKYPDGIPVEELKKKIYDKELLFHIFHSIIRDVRLPEIYKYQINIAKIILKKYSDIDCKEVAFAKYLLEKEAKRIKEEQLEAEYKERFQNFLDELALLILKKDEAGIYNHFRKHTYDDESAIRYTEIVFDIIFQKADLATIDYEIYRFDCTPNLKYCSANYFIQTKPEITFREQSLSHYRGLGYALIISKNSFLLKKVGGGKSE